MRKEASYAEASARRRAYQHALAAPNRAAEGKVTTLLSAAFSYISF